MTGPDKCTSHYDISSIPALLIFRDGTIAGRHVGVTSEAVLRTETVVLSEIPVEKASQRGKTTVRLSGHFQAEHVGELNKQLHDNGPRFVLDLKEVTVVDVDMVGDWMNRERAPRNDASALRSQGGSNDEQTYGTNHTYAIC
jgi:hypothetical protein